MLLDSDQDGQISAHKIELQTLPAEVLELFTPLFVEMDEMEQGLDEEEFCDAANRLYMTLTVP